MVDSECYEAKNLRARDARDRDARDRDALSRPVEIHLHLNLPADVMARLSQGLVQREGTISIVIQEGAVVPVYQEARDATL